jgi:hypothetical protein
MKVDIQRLHGQQSRRLSPAVRATLFEVNRNELAVGRDRD